ncbi:Acetylxylan esterase precursor [compost metagenome]
MVDKTIGPLQDLQKAMQMVRKRAGEWGLDPKKVGVAGFSAGGHLATTLGTHQDWSVIENKENINLRPDFMILVYPVILFDPQIPSGVRERLIGKNAPEALLDLFSNEKHVSSNTPPTFLVHTVDDDIVPVKNSLDFFDALLKFKVKASMHIFQAGEHGFGLDNPNNKDKWMDMCQHWLEENGF